jgi:hypothetical protein
VATDGAAGRNAQGSCAVERPIKPQLSGVYLRKHESLAQIAAFRISVGAAHAYVHGRSISSPSVHQAC